MAKKGLSKPFCAKYSNVGGTVTYSGGITCDKAIEYSVSVEAEKENPLYANNGICENSKGKFSSGELKLVTAGMPVELAKLILGLKEVTRTYGTSKTVKETVFDDTQDSPFLGFGIIEQHQVDNVDKYRAVILPKIVFAVPEDAATTREDKIDWQTSEIKGSVLRSDISNTEYKHPWKFDAWFDTEDNAEEYIKAVLTITNSGLPK